MRKKVKEQIKQDPEFGGDIKLLKEQTESVKEVAKQTKESGVGVSKVIKETFSSTTSYGIEQSKKILDEAEKISKPYVDELKQSAGKLADTEEVKQLTEGLKKTSETVERYSKTIADETAKHGKKVIEPAKNKINETADKVAKTDAVKVIKTLSRDATPKFNPTPRQIPMGRKHQSYNTALVISNKENRWTKLKDKITDRWIELADTNAGAAYVAETIDNFISAWKRVSSSEMGIMLAKLKKHHPEFSLESFQKWAAEELTPKTLTKGDLDMDYVQKHGSERIRRLHEDKMLPLPWKFINVSSVEVYPHEGEKPDFRFLISMRVQLKETEKVPDKDDPKKITKKDTICNVVLVIAAELSEDDIWKITEFQEIEKSTALF